MNDGSVRVFVQGTKDSLDEFASKIKNHAPKPILVEKIESKTAKVVPSVRSFRIKIGSQAMELQEGFGAMHREFSDYREEFKDYRNEFKDYRNEFKDYRNEFKVFASRTDNSFKTLGERYGEISQKLTDVIGTLERELAETRRDLTRAVDKLSSLVDEYIKAQQKNT